MSPKEESRSIRMVSNEGIFLFALSPIWSWIVSKLFNFIWEKVKNRLRFEGKTHFSRYLFVMFGDKLLSYMFGWLLGTPYNVTTSEFQESVKKFAKLHRRYHEFIGKRPCSACYAIYWNRFWFERIVSNRELAYERSKLFSECLINV